MAVAAYQATSAAITSTAAPIVTRTGTLAVQPIARSVEPTAARPINQ
jgi:hypothetical protein